jgi:N-acetylmuramoyl-L-alanine amidase
MAARKRFLALLLPALAGIALLSGCSTVRLKETNRTFDTVVIDAGHGGHDSGATRNGVVEKHAALDVSRRLEGKLRAEGFRTVMTRDRDVFIPLAKRARISNSQSNAIFVSVHFNYAPARKHRGAETYYYSKHSRSLAESIQRRIARISSPSRGVKFARFKVLRLNQYPSALVECGFVTNGTEAKRIAIAAHREKLASAIAEGIVSHRYPHGKPKPQPTTPPAPPSAAAVPPGAAPAAPSAPPGAQRDPADREDRGSARQ